MSYQRKAFEFLVSTLLSSGDLCYFCDKMSKKLYNPFDRFTFNEQTCFLTGEKAQHKIPVFPEWVSEQFQLREKPFKMLDERIVTYKDITVPVSDPAFGILTEFETELSKAFEGGYKAVRQLEEHVLFQWIAKFVYGIIHYEIRSGIRQQLATGEDFNFSQSLIHKFSNLQQMLQSLVRPVVFEGVLPWSILVFPVENGPDTFSYRDEINTLTFSLRMKDFGIIACLQDNGANKTYHREILDKVAGQRLHPIQFEELCGRFFYSAYLFNRLPEYTVLPTNEAVYIESMPFYSINGKPLFDQWQNKTYGQVLENFWKPWGFILFEILKDPENPMGFLLDKDRNFRIPDSINLG